MGLSAAWKILRILRILRNFVHWVISLEKPVADGTDALRDRSIETADFLNRGYLYFSDHSQKL
jgi:hypothetical protein